ncbi:MAG: pilin [bacterium]
MFKKIFIPILFISLVFGSVCSAGLLSDKIGLELGGDQATQLAKEAGYNEATTDQTLTQMIADVINVFLGLLGTIFVILIVVAGYRWMTAGGDKEKVSKAGDTIRAAILGLIIVAGAYAITYFVFRSLPEGDGGGTTIEATK